MKFELWLFMAELKVFDVWRLLKGKVGWSRENKRDRELKESC